MNSVEYWNGNARWYKLWVEHNNYHESIVVTLRSITRPGWKILDVGGGGGVLAIPLMMNHCNVTMLEPSWAMRDILECEIKKAGLSSTYTIDTRTWEEVDPVEFREHDIIMACNSLHLVRPGFKEAFKKMFFAEVPYIFIVTEKPVDGLRRFAEANLYQMILSSAQEQESAFVYHCRDEALEHWRFRYGREPNILEKHDLLSKLAEEEGHVRLHGKAMVYTYCWRHKKVDRQ